MACAGASRVRADQENTIASRYHQSCSFGVCECYRSSPLSSGPQKWRDALALGKAIIEPTDDDRSNAWIAYDRREAGNAGIIDLVSFTVMRRLGITCAFTNDQHLRAAGFETLF